MATIDEVKAALQTLTEAVNALSAAPATVTEVDVKESDGTEEVFVPKA